LGKVESSPAEEISRRLCADAIGSRQKSATCGTTSASTKILLGNPRWNIAPTQQVPTIRQHPAEPRRIFGLMRWGLIPYWAKDQSFGLKTINAMSETAAEKSAFRDALKRHRCLVSADGFYEWSRHEAACVIVRRVPLDRTCHPIGSTLRGMAIR
jgi:putative SOS response-associated peptidase YedK